MNNQKTPKLNPEATFREEFDGWGIIFNPETGDIFGLNPVSVLICKNINGKNTTADIHDNIRDSMAGMPGDSLDQIGAFIHQLAENNLVVFE